MDLEWMLTEDLLAALKSTNNCKSPGSDGYTAKSYKFV